MSILKVIKRYKYFLIFLFILILVSIYNNEFGVFAFKNIESSLLQMLSVLPPVMILLGLMDEWIPREYFMKYMGDNSKILGVILSFTFAFFAAGPMYAGFPFAAVLIKKGVKFSNILIFPNMGPLNKRKTTLQGRENQKLATAVLFQMPADRITYSSLFLPGWARAVPGRLRTGPLPARHVPALLIG